MLPNATDLVYFQEIAKTLNISKTAELLGISQPSLSLAIKRLEENIGAELLIREKRGVKLTRAGKELLIGTRKILDEWEKVSLNSLALKNEVKGNYQIGCHASVALYSLPSFVPDIVEKFPKLSIDFYHDNSKNICQRIIDHETDLGLVINPIAHPDLILIPLFKDEVCFWKHKNYKIHEGTNLICDGALTQTMTLLKKSKKYNFDPRKVVTSNNLEVIASLTENQVGVGILPARVVENSKEKNLVRLKDSPVFKDQLCLVYHLQAKGLKTIEVLKDLIKEKLS